MMFCNPGPIAAACYLGKDVVQSAIDAIVKAIIDLTDLNHNMNIDFGFCKISINNKDLKYTFKKDIIEFLNEKDYE